MTNGHDLSNASYTKLFKYLNRHLKRSFLNRYVGFKHHIYPSCYFKEIYALCENWMKFNKKKIINLKGSVNKSKNV